jgi:hypothetical protein
VGQPGGEAAKPALQILHDAAASLRAADSFRVEGRGTLGGQPNSSFTAAVAPSSLSLDLAQGGQVLQAIFVGGSAYVRANAAYWQDQTHSTAAAAFANRWISTRASSSQLGSLQLTGAALGRCLLFNHGTLGVVRRASVGGHPVVVIADRGDRPGSTPTEFSIATTGQPVLLRALATGNQRPGGRRDAQCNGQGGRTGDELTISDYNQPLHITAPAQADLSALGG